MFSTHIISWEEHTAFLERLKFDTSSKYWFVEDLGVISLRKLDLKHKNAYLGIYKNPNNKEKGAASELMKFLLEKTFDDYQLHTLKLEVFSDNRRAITFYNKCGFNQEGRLRELYCRENGNYVDLVLMGITDFEYKNYNDQVF